MKYLYFISFNLKFDGGTGWGNICIKVSNKINSFDDIIKITELIKKQENKKNKNVNIVIINYQLLDKVKD